MVGQSSLNSPAATILSSQKYIPLKYLKTSEIFSLLPVTIPASNIKVLKNQNAIVAIGTEEKIREIENYIRVIDQAPQQVMIEVLVVEYTDSRAVDFGLSGSYQYKRFDGALSAVGNLGGDFNLKAVGTLPEDFSVSLHAQVSKGKAKVRANPQIATINGKEASINVGWVGYYEITSGTQDNPITSLQSIQAGIVMRIVPWANSLGEITTELHQEVSGAVPGSQGLPEVTKRTVDTTIRVRDGETIIIGGLIQSEEQKNSKRIPLLGDIPFVGWLFGDTSTTKRKSELVTYITPHILPYKSKLASIEDE